jgi:hypothetical protein
VHDSHRERIAKTERVPMRKDHLAAPQSFCAAQPQEGSVDTRRGQNRQVKAWMVSHQHGGMPPAFLPHFHRLAIGNDMSVGDDEATSAPDDPASPSNGSAAYFNYGSTYHVA